MKRAIFVLGLLCFNFAFAQNMIEFSNYINNQEIKKVKNFHYLRKNKFDNKQYLKYKNILSNEEYEIYKIIDRLLRANKLQFKNYRFAFNLDKNTINAAALNNNLIVINSSLYDCLHQNNDALAFVIAHELAHFVLLHQEETIENEYKIQKIDNELLNIEKHYQQKMQFENLSKILNQNTMINSDNLNLRTINNLKQLKNNIYLKQKELELLADSEALNMVLRAGYDIDLAQEVFDYAQNDSFYNEKTYYPLVYQRIDNIKEELSFTDKNLLALEGKNNLLNSEVLSIQKSIDKETLIINKPKNYKDYSYKTISREEKILNKAYSFYKNGDFLNSIEYFKKAYDKNPNNYIAPLFLSCCYEKLYEQNNCKKDYTMARKYIKIAKTNNPKNEDVIKQYKNLYKR